MNTAFIVGYDPGGKNAHGVAVMGVRETNGRWNPISLDVMAKHALCNAVAWLKTMCDTERLIAVGIDTLTEWNSGAGGWRPADLWLRQRYPVVANSVVAPNSIYGSMAVNGAAFLALLASRFESESTMITEAHPKVCYFAMRGRKHSWAEDQPGMATWLLKELEIDKQASIFSGRDHCFDAGMAALAALRGLNRDWTLDLHAFKDEGDGRVQFFGQTHFWWPNIGRLGA